MLSIVDSTHSAAANLVRMTVLHPPLPCSVAATVPSVSRRIQRVAVYRLSAPSSTVALFALVYHQLACGTPEGGVNSADLTGTFAWAVRCNCRSRSASAMGLAESC